MDDVKVRHTKKANHVKMEGTTIPVSEMFDLGREIKTMSPGNSGDATNDIHCRCYLAYDLESNNEGFITSIKASIPGSAENKVKKFDKQLNDI